MFGDLRTAGFWGLRTIHRVLEGRDEVKFHCKRMKSNASNEKGFTLVELMVVVGILAILSTVAIPAYVNYMNRTTQSEAVTALVNARMDQEVFFERNLRYAGTAGCLTSLYTAADTRCLSDCSLCTQTQFLTNKGYRVSITAANTQNFTIAATKKYYSYAPADRLEITADESNPQVKTPDAIGFSLFDWIFK